MAVLFNRKSVLDSPLYRRITGSLSADSGIAFQILGFPNVRAFSSLEDAEIGNGKNKNQDELKLHQVRCLLSEYGFTTEQVTKVSKYSASRFRIAKTISPKLAFLRSILGSNDDVAKVVSANPRVLASSLKNKLMPNYQFVKSILGRDELVAKSIRRSPLILHMDVPNNLAVKVSILSEYGLPRASMAKLMEYSPHSFTMFSSSKLEESVKKALALGFEPSSPMTAFAIGVISQINESTWDRKVELYRKWGWSEKDFLLAFKKQPFVMRVSEEKINKGMDAFLNVFGFSSSDIVKYPHVIFMSVEERIIPRCSVVSLLFSEGILGGSPRNFAAYAHALWLTDEVFVNRFVDKYPGHVHVLELWLKLRRRTVA